MVSGNRWLLAWLMLTAATAEATPVRRRHVTMASTRVAALVEPPSPPEPAVVEPPPPLPPAPKSELVRERRWGLFGGGAALFAAGWAIDIGASYGVGHQPASLSLIPLVGPLAQMGDNWHLVPSMKSGNPQVDVPANQRIDALNRAIQTGAYVILAVDFALQLAGVTMAIVGGAGSKTTRAYADARGLAVRF